MLTDESYQSAMWVYTGAAVLALLLFNFWMLRGRGLGLRFLLTLPLGALLLTPAYIAPGASTMAPAMVVLAFQWFSKGPEAAEHALNPLLLFTGVAFGVGVVLALVLRLFSRAESPATDA